MSPAGPRLVVTWSGLLLAALLLALYAGAPVARAADAERIIVTNTRLVGRNAASQDVPVNLLIVDGRLSVVTKDELVIQPGEQWRLPGRGRDSGHDVL